MKNPEETAVPEPSPAPAGMRVSPFCAHLRTKKAYFLREPALEEEDLLDASGHCWCLKTMLALGPDGEPVLPSDCRAGRACFESIL
jgi:hypothetical protein